MDTTPDKDELRLAQRVSNLEADLVWRSRQVLFAYTIFAATVVLAAFVLSNNDSGVSKQRFEEVTHKLCLEIQELRSHLQLPPTDCVSR